MLSLPLLAMLPLLRSPLPPACLQTQPAAAPPSNQPSPTTAAPPCSTRVCAHCGVHKDRAPGGRLQQCSACKEAGRAPTYFCSQACSEAAWPTHKILCKGLLP